MHCRPGIKTRQPFSSESTEKNILKVEDRATAATVDEVLVADGST